MAKKEKMRKFVVAIIINLMALVFSGKSHALIYSHETDKVKIEVFTSQENINPEQSFEYIIKFSMKNGWHILANPAGDIGRPTTVDMILPEGYTQQYEKWSAHKRFETEGIIQYGWDDNAYYQTQIIPSDLINTEVEIPIDIEWQACKDECIPEKVRILSVFKVTELNVIPSPVFERITQEASSNFEKNSISLLMILLFAFVGGIILNFMPCVFPVLSLKIISLAQSNKNDKHIKIDALLYLCGVVLSFVVVAGVMVMLRMQGESVGWGFQLQSPYFVAVMLAIFIFIFLMLLDVVHIPILFADKIAGFSSMKNRIGAFATGFFAVLIASPCTAPFMGIAIGYTLTQSVIMSFLVFIAVGFGYALPFTLAGFMPELLRKIMPKSGRWLGYIKKIFAIPVFFTCVWLLWILVYQMGVINHKNSNLKWIEYEEQQIESLKNKGESIFIDFTAKWCLTCLLNEKSVLDSNDFEKLVKEKNIHLFKADWTNENSEITNALAKYGRNSIPLYIYYDGESAETRILPQVLTSSIINEYIQ